MNRIDVPGERPDYVLVKADGTALLDWDQATLDAYPDVVGRADAEDVWEQPIFTIEPGDGEHDDRNCWCTYDKTDFAAARCTPDWPIVTFDRPLDVQPLPVEPPMIDTDP